MNPWLDCLLELERRRDEVARAEKEHQINRALRNGQVKPRRRPRRHEIFLFSLGLRFVRWGRRLQVRYRGTVVGMGPGPLVIPRRAGKNPPPW